MKRRHKGSARVGPGKFLRSKTRRADSEAGRVCGCPCEDDWRCYAVAPPRAPHATARATRCEHGAPRNVTASVAAGSACRFYRASATTDDGSGAGAAEPSAERSAPRPTELRRRAASASLPLLQSFVDHQVSRRGSGRPSGAPCAPPARVAFSTDAPPGHPPLPKTGCNPLVPHEENVHAGYA